MKLRGFRIELGEVSQDSGAGAERGAGASAERPEAGATGRGPPQG